MKTIKRPKPDGSVKMETKGFPREWKSGHKEISQTLGNAWKKINEWIVKARRELVEKK